MAIWEDEESIQEYLVSRAELVERKYLRMKNQLDMLQRVRMAAVSLTNAFNRNSVMLDKHVKDFDERRQEYIQWCEENNEKFDL